MAKPRRRRISAGLLMYRHRHATLEVFLGHPGGPFWASRDLGAWSIPKGEPAEGEDLEATARREFEEETGLAPATPLQPLGAIRQKGGKEVHAWAFQGDWIDGRLPDSNTFSLEWPRGSGTICHFPEIDQVAFFDLAAAREKINPAQIPLLERLVALLAPATG